MPYPCSRLSSIPRWALAFGAGILIGWTTYAFNTRLYREPETEMLVSIPRNTPPLVRNFHTTITGNLSHSHHERLRVPPKYYATDKFDLQSWQYFDHSAIFDDESLSMVRWRHADRNTDAAIKTALEQATQLVGRELGKTVLMKELTSGYMRHNPTRGYEYIIDANYVDTCSNCVAKPFSRRVSFVQVLSDPVPVPDIATSGRVVNVIVPISNVNTRFSEFMDNFEKAFLENKDAVHLVLVVYQKDMRELEKTLSGYRSRHKSARITLIHGQGTFSRGRALHQGIASLENSDDLVFICDVDITIERSFMDRCRRNPIQGQRVFYPVVFKLYDSRYTHTKKSKTGKVSINRKNGHWFYYSYGMLCIFRSDYMAVGGLDIQIEGWGLEDVLLYKAILNAKLEVLKVPDPALTHRWHESHCPSSLPSKQHSDCLGSLYEGVADKKELAQYIYEHDYQIKSQ